MNDGVDPTIKALASTIGELETGPSSPDAYTKKGLSGEYGRYQLMPDTYKSYAKKYVGDGNAAPTIENQNKIVYNFIKEKKDSGYNPAQIMSMWNAGEARPNAYKENWRGVNSQGVSYDTPAYVQKGSNLYQQKKAQSLVGGAESPVTEQAPETLGGKLAGRLHDASGALSNALSGQMAAPLISAPLQMAGAAAGAVGDVVGAGLDLIPGVKQAEQFVGKGIGALANTSIGQKLVSGAQGFSEAHPELSKDIGAAGNVGGLLLGGAGGKLGASAAKEGLLAAGKKGLIAAGGRGILERSATKNVAASAGEMTRKELEREAHRVLPSGELLPSKTEARAGQILAEKSSKNPVKNYAAIQGEISSRGKEAEKFLKRNAKAVTNAEDFNAFDTVGKDAMKYMTDSDAKAYKEQIDLFQKILKEKGGYSTPNYYSALKEYEKEVTSNLPKGHEALLVPGGSARVRAAKDVRSSVRKLLSTKHKNFKGKMFDLAALYDVRDNVASKVARTAKYGKQPGLIKRGLYYGAKKLGQGALIGAGLAPATHFLEGL